MSRKKYKMRFQLNHHYNQHLTEEQLSSAGKELEEARLDIATRGFWHMYEMAFFDIRVFNLFTKSYRNQTLYLLL